MFSQPTRSHCRSHLDANHFEVFGTGISEGEKDHSRSHFGVDGWWDLTPENQEKMLRVLRNCALLKFEALRKNRHAFHT